MNQIRVAMKTKVLLVVLFVFAQVGWTHADWPTAHGAPDNSGLARVDTVAAIRPIAFVDVGQIAPGANPVIGPDGTVYVGNLAGELIALHPDGKPYWKRNLNPEHGPIFASPAVGADGSIYVVSSMSYLDQRSGNPVHTAFLHKFLAGGAWAFSRTFPKASLYPFTDGGATTAPPNTWRWNGTEAIMVPVVYKALGRSELRIIAYSTSGVVLGDRRVTVQVYDTSATSTSFLQGIIDFFVDRGLNFGGPPPTPVPLPDAGWPQPGVAIWESGQGSPYVWVADSIRSTVAYRFDPTTGFAEVYRSTAAFDRLSSPPVALDNLVAAVGLDNGCLTFERENSSLCPPASDAITPAPTRLADGRFVTIARNGNLAVSEGHSFVLQQRLNGESIASAAASCTHLFVSSTRELVTFDPKSMMPVARFSWTGGGRHAPIIGPLGQVYAMMNVGLFVFAPPATLPFLTFAGPRQSLCNIPIVTGTVQ
jgi:hypothetical protein